MHLQQKCEHMTQPRSRFEISLESCLTVPHDSILNSAAGGATLRPRCPGGMALVESQEVGAAHHLSPLQPLRRPQNQQKRRRWGFHHALQPAVQSEVSGGPHEAYGLLLTGVQARSVLCCTIKHCISVLIGPYPLDFWSFIHGQCVGNSDLTICMLMLCTLEFAA